MSRKKPTSYAPRWSALFELPDGTRVATGQFDAPEHADTFGEHFGQHITYLGPILTYRTASFGIEIARQLLAGQADTDGRRGLVTHWGDTWGFIADDQGQCWFVSQDALPEGVDQFPVGTRVRFAGVPEPLPHRRYPNALDVEADQEGALAPAFIAARDPFPKETR